MKCLYLIIEMIALAIPLLFSFYRKASFRKDWKWLLPAIGAVGVFFLLWDAQFIRMGIWGFNPKYTIGPYLWGLPIEEFLYFFCISYLYTFVYYCVRYFLPGTQLKYSSRIVCGVASVLLFVVGVLNYDKWYTVVTCIGASGFLAFCFLKKPFWLGHFIIAYCISAAPFLLINGMLTGTGLEEPIIWHNPNENLGLFILTIPVEDTLYALLLLGPIVSIYEFIKSR